MKVSIVKHLSFELIRIGAPLRPLSFIFKAANAVGGFTFKALDQECSKFQWNRSALIRLFLFLSSIIVISLGPLAYNLYELGGFFVYVDLNRENGLALMDTVAIGLILFPHLIATFAFVNVFSDRKFPLNVETFCRKVLIMRGLEKIKQDTYDDIYKKVKQQNMIFFVLITVASGLQYVSIYFVMASPGLSNVRPWTAFAYIPFTVHVCFPLSEIVANMLIFQTLGTLEQFLKMFKKKLDSLVNSSECTMIQPQTSIVEPAFDIVELAEFIDEFIGPLILIEYCLSFVVEVIGAFFGVLVTTAFTAKGINWVVLTSCGGSSILGMAAIWRMWRLASMGQALSSIYEDMLALLNKSYTKYYKDFNAKDRCDMQILFDRYSVTAPIRPLEVFHMNRSSILTATSFVLTYIFVLMQFRIGT